MSTALSGEGQMMGAGINAYSQFNAGQTTAMLQRANAAIAGRQAHSELVAGEEQGTVLRQKIAATIGQQEAAVGASGVAAYGSPNKVIEDTAGLGAADLERLRTNSMRRAWGFQTTAAGDLFHAKAAQSAGVMNTAGTLITGGAKAYSTWNQDE